VVPFGVVEPAAHSRVWEERNNTRNNNNNNNNNNNKGEISKIRNPTSTGL
jgi:hypothetical protein